MMIHPATAHFAMVLPIVASVFGGIYLYTKSEVFKKISSFAFIISAIATGVVWYTGSQAGAEIYKHLTQAGQATLIEHKTLGLYLAIAMALIALIKVIGCRINSFALQALSVLLLLGATAATLHQGKEGGEIVYKHGMPFKAAKILNALNKANSAADEEDDADTQVEIYQDTIDNIMSLSEEVDEVLGNPKPADTEEEE